jgi:hypothetical protein
MNICKVRTDELHRTEMKTADSSRHSDEYFFDVLINVRQTRISWRPGTISKEGKGRGRGRTTR